jgi:glycosyltransferase involved in cell wall biosynthesis
LKVIYFSSDYCTHDHRFLATIREGGHQAYHLRLQANPRQVEDRPVPEGVEIVHWAGGQRPFRWRDLPRLALDFRRVVERIQPDLVHAGPIQTCAFIAALSGFRPLLTMSWGFDLMEDVHRNWWWEWVTRFTLSRSTFFTSDAQVTRDTAVECGMNPDRTVVFPWGVDISRFAPKPHNREPRSGNRKPFLIFCNRSWEPRYGVDVLAKAFVKIAEAAPNVRMMLMGGGSQGARIRQILLNGGVLDRVQFPGQISQTDLPRWYHMADVYISPSHVDGSSVSLMEALASGLPCLVSDIPANCEWVSEGVNGWLFPDGDADALAGKILQAVVQRERLPVIRRAARAVAEERADWKKNADKLFAAYRQAVELA